MKRVSVDKILKWRPCVTYDRLLIRKLFKGRKTSSAQQIADLPIPATDRAWVLGHMMTPKNAQLCACVIAARVVRTKGVLTKKELEKAIGLLRVGRAVARGKKPTNDRVLALLAARSMTGKFKGPRRYAKSVVFRSVLEALTNNDWWRLVWYSHDHASHVAGVMADPHLSSDYDEAKRKEEKLLMKIMVHWVNK